MNLRQSDINKIASAWDKQRESKKLKNREGFYTRPHGLKIDLISKPIENESGFEICTVKTQVQMPTGSVYSAGYIISW